LPRAASNAAINTKGEGDSPAKHLDDTMYGGDFSLTSLVKRMTDMGLRIVYLFDRMGITIFGNERRFDGFSPVWWDAASPARRLPGASTGQQLLYALDEQVRRQEARGR